MNNILLFAYIIFLLLITTSRIYANEQDKGFIWKLNSDSQNTIYILGSSVYTNTNYYPLSTKIINAFDNTDILVIEVDYDSLDMAYASENINNMSTIKDNLTLEDVLSEELFIHTKEHIQELGFNYDNWSTTNPVNIADLIWTLDLLKSGCDFKYRFENYFIDKAKNVNKRIKSLTTVQTYLNNSNIMPVRIQEQYLQKVLYDLKNISVSIAKTNEFWKSGNFESYRSFYNKSFQEYPDLFKYLFFNDYEDWVNKIEKFIKSGHNHFIVVDIGYLVGDKGLISALSKKGFKVEKL